VLARNLREVIRDKNVNILVSIKIDWVRDGWWWKYGKEKGFGIGEWISGWPHGEKTIL